MANRKISELSATTQANDNVFLVMNNSGNTETFRIKRSDLLSGTTTPAGFIQGDASQSLVPYYFETSAATAADTTYVDKLNVVSDEIKTTSTAVLLGGTNNSKGTNTSFGVIGGSNNTASNRSGIVFSNNTTSGVDGFVFGAQDISNQIGNSPTRPNVVIGGKYHRINTNFSSYNGLFAGSNNYIYSNQHTPHYGNYHIIGGSYNLIGKGTNASPVRTFNANFGSIINSHYGQIEEGDFNTIIGSNNVNISGLTGTTLIGLENFTATTSNTTYVDNLETLGSVQVPTGEKIRVGTGQYTEIEYNSIKQVGNGATASIASNNSQINQGLSVSIAGPYHTIDTNRSLAGVGYGTKILGSGTANLNLSDGSVVNNSSQVGIVGGEENNITSSDYTGMLSGNKNTITNSTSSQMVGGSGNTISGLDNVVILGGSGISATTSNTTYVDNSHTLRTETFDTISGGSVSGVVSVDLSQGTLYKFSITGNITSVDFINWREGQRAEFIVENTASYTISAMTITGGGSVYVQGGSVNPTNNAFTKYRGVIVDGDMFLNEELNFQPFV